jgi:hypothetical protein
LAGVPMVRVSLIIQFIHIIPNALGSQSERAGT